jgi:transposase
MPLPTSIDPLLTSHRFVPLEELTSSELRVMVRSQQTELRQYRSQVARQAALRPAQLSAAQTKDGYIHQLENEVRQLEEKLVRKDKYIAKEKKAKQALKEQLQKVTDQAVTQSKTISRLNGMLFKFTGKPMLRSKRKRGGQLGHKGYGRHATRSEEDSDSLPVDEIIRCFAEVCPDCGNSLPRANSCQTHTVTDIPELTKLLAKVTCYEIEQQWCGNCKKQVTAKLAGLLSRTKLGLNTISLILIYRYTCHIPLAKIKYLLNTCYQLTISEGGIQNILARAKTWFGNQYGELLVMLRAARIKYADETGWKIGKLRAWIWGFFTSQVAYYAASPSRGGGIPAKILFDVNSVDDLPAEVDEQQLLIRDDYKGYLRLPMLQQSCWAHLLRFAKEEYESAPKKTEARKLYTILKALYRKLARALSQDEARKAKVYTYVWRVLTQIMQTGYTTKAAQAVQTRITNQAKQLLTALKFAGAELTNNYSERMIRPMAIARKISGGSRSDEGAEILAINASIVQTIRLQDKDLVTTLGNLITGQPTGLFSGN